MDKINELRNIVKAKIGISTDARNDYIDMIIKSVLKELEDEKGIKMDISNENHFMFVVDYAEWRYQNRDGNFPRHLQFRLHNLIISNKK